MNLQVKSLEVIDWNFPPTHTVFIRPIESLFTCSWGALKMANYLTISKDSLLFLWRLSSEDDRNETIQD
jgi:hypothetical protein